MEPVHSWEKGGADHLAALGARKSGLWLADEHAVVRERFETGETVFIVGRGLRPFSSYEIIAGASRAPSGHTLLAALLTDRHGNLPATALLPHLGLFDAYRRGKPVFRSFEEADSAMGGKNITIRVTLGSETSPVAVLDLAVVGTSKLPQIIPCDIHGHFLPGIVAGEADVAVALRNFPPGCVRVVLVSRQMRWQPGDPIEPVRGTDGTPVVTTSRVGVDRSLILRLWPRGQTLPGSYQFIARAYPPGWYQADAEYLLPGDIVSARRITSLVVRRPLHLADLYENGVVLTPELAGRPLSHPPYFTFVNNFPKGTDVWAALDPDALPPGLVSQRAAIYVIPHKTAAQWSASNAVMDVSGPGMTSAVKIVPVVPGCVNWNETLVWPNPQAPGKYDLVVDFGNNAADPAQFATDGTLDSPLDMIDGYVRVGFYVTEDPSLPGPFAAGIGQHSYDLGSIQVPNTDTGPNPTDTIPVRAVIRYPAQFSGVDAPFAAGVHPLIVIMHGNSGLQTSYLGYNYLLDHLAGHGFIAMSIHVPPGVFIETRARAILHHLGVMSLNNGLPGLFQGHIDLTRIGIVGHSRGGEAVVRAARINTLEALGWNLKAGISIAPTDYHHYGDPGVPLLVIYGSNDGDVSGSWPDRTCFNIFDEAGKPRSFVFVYGGTHDRFNTEWASIEATVEFQLEIGPGDIPKLISVGGHEDLAKGYVTAYCQTYVQGESEQGEYFSAGLKPSLVSALQIHISHQEPGALALDNFEEHNPAQNTLGGSVTSSSLPSAPAEDQLRTLDSYSPHVTSGAQVTWSGSQGTYRSLLPAASKNVSGFNVLAFRVTQRYGSISNPAQQPQDFRVRLTDVNQQSRAIRVGVFTDIPYPYERTFTTRIKSAMKTVRIPLEAYMVANLGQGNVDLTKIESVSFEFGTTATGEIEIDDIEFTT